MTVLRCGLLVAVVGAVAVLLTSAGCGHRAAPPAPKAEPAAKQSVPLPDWAPKHPSPEFLRAARVLKPIPQEAPDMEGGRGSLATQVVWARYLHTLPSAYELFGTLSDEQIRRFLGTKEIRLSVRTMPTAQRAALDKWFADWQAAFKGTGNPDWLVVLYKLGAKRDLSNVSAGFSVLGRTVRLWFWVLQPDGQVKSLGNGIAMI
jgi:hypothetical protein